MNRIRKADSRGCKIQKKVSNTGTVRYQIAVTIPLLVRHEFGGLDRLYFRSASYKEVAEKKKEFEARINEVYDQYVQWSATSESELWAIMKRWKNVNPKAR